MVTVGDKIENYIRLGKWPVARSLILKELKKTPEDHWLLTRLSTTYYEERKYDKALIINKRALKLAPQCPLVMWDYAGTLDMIGRHKSAIQVWKTLLNIGIQQIAHDECGEGVRWARSLLNDTRYRIGISYWKMGKLSMATLFLQSHLDHRAPGIPSIYNLATARRELNVIQSKLKNKTSKRMDKGASRNMSMTLRHSLSAFSVFFPQ